MAWYSVPEIVAEVPGAGERQKGTEAQGTEQAEPERVTNPEKTHAQSWSIPYARNIDVKICM